MILKVMVYSLLVASAASAQDLRRVDYKDQGIDSQKTQAPATAEASLSAEDANKMLEQIETIKKKQAESQKALNELEKDE